MESSPTHTFLRSSWCRKDYLCPYFAKAINCEHPREDGEACNECESCTAFNEQRSFNIFELDAASNNGVEQIKALMEQTRIPPQIGKYKVFIIDEVHMLSSAAFNAFLKTLEEPPSHVIFILATTEKHKILPTILSRCQIYDFERMTVPNTIKHLAMVAEKKESNMRNRLWLSSLKKPMAVCAMHSLSLTRLPVSVRATSLIKGHRGSECSG